MARSNNSLPLKKLIADFRVVIGLKIGNQFLQGGVIALASCSPSGKPMLPTP